MPTEEKDLGKLISVHGIAPAYMQRAIFTAVLAFMFFMATMFAFYIRQSPLYFLLSTAFLLVYLLTMFSWVRQTRSVVKIYENGIGYRKRFALWSEIEALNEGVLSIRLQKPITIPTALHEPERVTSLIKAKAGIA